MMKPPRILQQVQHDILHLGWVPGEVQFEVFPPDDEDPAWHLYAFPRLGDDGSAPFFLELTLITDRLDLVTSILFDSGTEDGAPASVRIRGMAGTKAVMVCILQRPVEFEGKPQTLVIVR